MLCSQAPGETTIQTTEGEQESEWVRIIISALNHFLRAMTACCSCLVASDGTILSWCLRLLEGHVKILPEIELPPHPNGVYACPAHIRDSCHATQLIARTPECALYTRAQLELCKNRLQVQIHTREAFELQPPMMYLPSLTNLAHHYFIS